MTAPDQPYRAGSGAVDTGPPTVGSAANRSGSADPAASTTALVLLSAWRLVFCAVAWWGIYTGLTPSGGWRPTNLFLWSQLSTLAVALTATGTLLWPLFHAGRLEARRGYLRGATTTYAVGTLILFPLLLGGSYTSRASQLMHLAVPLMALVDWLAAGRNQERVPWWAPFAWLAVPVLYLQAYLARSAATGPLYRFLDPDRPNFLTWVMMLILAFLALGVVVWALGRLRGVAVRSIRHAG